MGSDRQLAGAAAIEQYFEAVAHQSDRVKIVDWVLKTKDTIYEGAPMPWRYHKYAGHDINRDAFMMNMVESRNLARFFYREWHPHVFLSMHQMGSNGARMFVPPVADPIDRN